MRSTKYVYVHPDAQGQVCCYCLSGGRDVVNASILTTMAPAASIENLCTLWESRAHYTAAGASGVRLESRSAHGSHFDAVDKRLYDWVVFLSRKGRECILFTISLLQEKAKKIGDQLGLGGFGASWGSVQAWARRHI